MSALTENERTLAIDAWRSARLRPGDTHPAERWGNLVLAAYDSVARDLDALIGGLWDLTKPPSSPLWWCLREDLQDGFRVGVMGMIERTRAENERRRRDNAIPWNVYGLPLWVKFPIPHPPV